MKTQRLATLAFFAVAVVLAASNVSAGPPANEFQLAAGYAAKEACSCVFIENQTDAYCTNYGTLPTGLPLTLAIDHTANTVTARYSTATRIATFTAGQGCVLAGL